MTTKRFRTLKAAMVECRRLLEEGKTARVHEDTQWIVTYEEKEGTKDA